MKKILSFVFIAFIASVVFAASYKNNTYQKLAKEYTIKAEKALDAGEYVLAEEYAQKAQENADLSDAYIAHMMAKETADRNIALAKNRIEAAKKLKAEENFPMAFEEALKSLERSNEFYAKEDYENASNAALQVINLLAGVYEVIPLPKYYIIKP